jgi:hypothetical protein
MMGTCFVLLRIVIGDGFGSGDTQCLKERNGEDSFLSYGNKRMFILNVSDPLIH